MTITVTVTKRIATISATERIVAGNTYPIALALDSEWTGSLFMRVRFGSLYYDIPFASSDTSVNVQFPVGYPEVGIGIFSEALEICSNETRVRLLRSILEQGVSVVDFDGDLYDQWAGEVTTLLTDDAFDAESTRPVQNAVLTAWKDTVPLDANLVHKTGNEEINGNKTFLQTLLVRAGGNPYVEIEDTNPSSAYGGFRSKSSYLVTGGTTKVVGEFIATRDSGSNPRSRIMIRTTAPNGSASSSVTAYSFDDGTVFAECPTFTANNDADYKIVNRAMLARTPTIVHTTGTETVAGAKTFTSTPTVSQSSTFPEIYFKTGVEAGSDSWKGRLRFYDRKDGADSIVGDIALFGKSAYNYALLRVNNVDRSHYYDLELRSYTDHGLAIYTSYYPVDGSGNPQALTTNALVTSGNIAVDPRIVHTSGIETIAGNKTFTGITFIDNPRFKRSNHTLHSNGEWVKYYEFLPVSYGGVAVIRMFQTYYIYAWVGAEVRIRQGTPTSNPDARFYNMNSVAGKLAKRASDGVVEVWLQNTTTNDLGVLAEITVETGGSVKVASEVSQTAPAVGDTYSYVTDIQS